MCFHRDVWLECQEGGRYKEDKKFAFLKNLLYKTEIL